MTQCERLLDAMREGWLTYGDMQARRISTCPTARLHEAAHKHLRAGEAIATRQRPDGLTELRVVRDSGASIAPPQDGVT